MFYEIIVINGNICVILLIKDLKVLLSRIILYKYINPIYSRNFKNSTVNTHIALVFGQVVA